MSTVLLSRPDAPLRAPGDLRILDSVTRRQFVAVLGAAGLFAACGQDADSGDTAGHDGATRSIDAANGTVEVPAEPARVISIDPVTTEHLAVLGVDAHGAQVEGFFEPLAACSPRPLTSGRMLGSTSR